MFEDAVIGGFTQVLLGTRALRGKICDLFGRKVRTVIDGFRPFHACTIRSSHARPGFETATIRCGLQCQQLILKHIPWKALLVSVYFYIAVIQTYQSEPPSMCVPLYLTEQTKTETPITWYDDSITTKLAAGRSRSFTFQIKSSPNSTLIKFHSVKFPSLSQCIDKPQSVRVCVCMWMFASTHVISSGQVSVCLPVVLLWNECLPKECTTSDLSLTLIVRLIQLVPWAWLALCPGKWEICAFLPFFPLWFSAFAHVLGQKKCDLLERY